MIEDVRLVIKDIEVFGRRFEVRWLREGQFVTQFGDTYIEEPTLSALFIRLMYLTAEARDREKL